MIPSPFEKSLSYFSTGGAPGGTDVRFVRVEMRLGVQLLSHADARPCDATAHGQSDATRANRDNRLLQNFFRVLYILPDTSAVFTFAVPYRLTGRASVVHTIRLIFSTRERPRDHPFHSAGTVYRRI